jgi:hypothetical protein
LLLQLLVLLMFLLWVGVVEVQYTMLVVEGQVVLFTELHLQYLLEASLLQ